MIPYIAYIFVTPWNYPMLLTSLLPHGTTLCRLHLCYPMELPYVTYISVTPWKCPMSLTSPLPHVTTLCRLHLCYLMELPYVVYIFVTPWNYTMSLTPLLPRGSRYFMDAWYKFKSLEKCLTIKICLKKLYLTIKIPPEIWTSLKTLLKMQWFLVWLQCVYFIDAESTVISHKWFSQYFFVNFFLGEEYNSPRKHFHANLFR